MRLLVTVWGLPGMLIANAPAGPPHKSSQEEVKATFELPIDAYRNAQ
jgi:hypothetical protein